MLSMMVRLRFGVFDAGSSIDPRRGEWPPNPARAFCALVASGPEGVEWQALRWLERQGPPLVHASDVLAEIAPEQFMVNNVVGGNSPTLPVRANGVRIKPRIVPMIERFWFCWPEAEPDAETLAALRSLAARVPYLGRSTSDAEVQFDTSAPPEEPSMSVFEPTDARLGEFGLRVPYEGYADRLVEAFDAGRFAWEESRWVDYRVRRAAEPPPVDPVRSPFSDVVVFRFLGTSRLHSTQVVRLAEVLRAAMLSHVPDPVPESVSGHGADGRTHVAFIGLPNVGTPSTLPGWDGPSLVASNLRADGRLMGMALALPRGDAAALAATSAFLRAMADSGLRLTLGPAGVVQLAYEPGRPQAWALSPSRWTQSARLWASATPLVLDRFPKRRHDTTTMVADAFEKSGFPRPVALYCQTAPLLPGGAQFRRSAVQRRAGVPSRPWVHAWVAFDRPVSGPVLAGSMRYRGLGLFVPIELARDEISQEVSEPDTGVEGKQ